MSQNSFHVQDFRQKRFLKEFFKTYEETDDVEIDLDDEFIVKMPRCHAIFCAIIWQVYFDFKMKITKSMVPKICEGTSQKNLAAYYTDVYWNLLYADVSREKALGSLFKSLMTLQNFITVYCIEYAPSICYDDMAEIVTDPKVKALEDIMKKCSKESPAFIEKEFARTKDILIKYIRNGELQNNALMPFILADSLNTKQINQLLVSISTRTDINESTIMRPIIPSYFRGMVSPLDHLTESRSAVKVDLYSKTAVSMSQTMAKRIRLATTVIAKIHKGSCGNDITIPVLVTEPKNFLGKIIVEDGKDVEITKKNMGRYKGEIVNLVSACTCRCKDGICERCAGRILKDFTPRGLIPGMISTIRIVEPVTQGILSSKHLTSTDSKEYKLDQSAVRFFNIKSNEIRFTNSLKKKKRIEFGFELESIKRSVDEIYQTPLKALPTESALSKVTDVFIRDAHGQMNVAKMQTDLGTPFLSKEIFAFMKETKCAKIEEDFIWFPIDALKAWAEQKEIKSVPIFKTIVKNNSLKFFVENVDRFLKGAKGVTNIADFTSVSEALSAFMNLIYEKVSVNVIHLECILRAVMVTSREDYSLPIVKDPNDVIFVTQPEAIMARSIGCQFANEKLAVYLRKPSTYLEDKPSGPFDPFFGL